MLNGTINKILYKIRRKIEPETVVVSSIRVSASLDDIPADIRKQLYKNDYEKGELTLVRKAIRVDDRVLEIGAGIGFISIACARICGSDRVISYEPNPAMKQVIEKNYKLNRVQPTLRKTVLASKAGYVEFFFSDNVLSSSLIDRKHGGKTVIEADAIDAVIKEYRPSAIVMDVEGAEIELLRSCDLSGVDKVVIEMHPHIVGQGLGLEERQGKRYLFLRSHR